MVLRQLQQDGNEHPDSKARAWRDAQATTKLGGSCDAVRDHM